MRTTEPNPLIGFADLVVKMGLAAAALIQLSGAVPIQWWMPGAITLAVFYIAMRVLPKTP